jgi:hypothetical protein
MERIDEYLEQLESLNPLVEEDREVLKLFSNLTELIVKIAPRYSIYPFWTTVNEFPSYHLGMLLHQYGTIGTYVSRYLGHWIFQRAGRGVSQYSKKGLIFYLKSTINYIKFLLQGKKPEELNKPNFNELFYIAPLSFLIEAMEATWYVDVDRTFEFSVGHSKAEDIDRENSEEYYMFIREGSKEYTEYKKHIIKALEKGVDLIDWLNSCKENDKNDIRCRRGYVSSVIREWGSFWKLVGWHFLNVPFSYFDDTMKKIEEYCNDIIKSPAHKLDKVLLDNRTRLYTKKTFAELKKAKTILEKYGDLEKDE